MKTKLIRKLENLPLIGPLVLSSARKLTFHLFSRPRIIVNNILNKHANVLELHCINIKNLQHISTGDFDNVIDTGRIQGGDWDLDQELIKDSLTFRGLKERFSEGHEWDETQYYKAVKHKLDSGQIQWMCKNEEELNIRLKNLDALFLSIKKKGIVADQKQKSNVYGYKDRTLLAVKMSKAKHNLDHIKVDIDRHGRVMLADGRHRCSIAKLLGIDESPVTVRVRHKQWNEFQKELTEYAKMQKGSRLEQKPYHFDLRGIPHDCDQECINTVKENTRLKGGEVLDVSASFGLFCHEMEKDGFMCRALENDREKAHFMQVLKNSRGDRFIIDNRTLQECCAEEPLYFDMVLMLKEQISSKNIKRSIDRLSNVTDRIKFKELFLGFYPMKNRLSGETPEKITRKIISDAGISEYEFLKATDEGHSVYRVSA